MLIEAGFAIDGSGGAFAVGVGDALFEVFELGVELLDGCRGGFGGEFEEFDGWFHVNYLSK